jgi:hypothetical protein
MQLQLQSAIVSRLLRFPEDGMGYQIVDLVLVDGRVIPNVTVLNGEIANLPESLRGIRASEIADVRPANSKAARR